MGKLWMKIWVWIKIIVFSLLALYVLAFIIENMHNDAEVWFAYKHKVQTTSLMLALCAFIGGVISTVLVRTTSTTIRQYREMKERKRQERMQRDIDEMRAKAEMLAAKPAATATTTPITTPAPTTAAPTSSEGASEH